MRTTSSMVGRDLGCGPADATGISRAMSYQYDIEDQADLTGVVMTEGLDWREQYVPVAPVQLTPRVVAVATRGRTARAARLDLGR